MRHGQHIGRDERIRQTTDWLNAKPLQLHGDPMIMDPQGHFDQAMQLCSVLRALLRSDQGAAIVVHEVNPLVREHLRSLLTSEELACLKFQQ